MNRHICPTVLYLKGPEKMIIKFTLYGENQVVPSGALVFFCAKPCIKFWLVSSLFICEMSDSDSANGNNTKMTCVLPKSVSIKAILFYGSVEINLFSRYRWFRKASSKPENDIGKGISSLFYGMSSTGSLLAAWSCSELQTSRLTASSTPRKSLGPKL